VLCILFIGFVSVAIYGYVTWVGDRTGHFTGIYKPSIPTQTSNKPTYYTRSYYAPTSKPKKAEDCGRIPKEFISWYRGQK
jgi:hypothetical protein